MFAYIHFGSWIYKYIIFLFMDLINTNMFSSKNLVTQNDSQCDHIHIILFIYASIFHVYT